MDKQMQLVEANFDKVLAAGSIKSAMKETGSKSRDLWQVPVDQIKVIEGLNPRVMNDQYRAHIRMLADSIRSEGFYQDCPLAGYVAKEVDDSGVEQQVIFIYSGHSRLLATKLANKEGAQIERLPISVSQEGLSMEDINVSIVRGNGGKNLTYYESAIICKRLVRYGMEIEEIATRTGITIPLVKNRLLLMSAPGPLRVMVANEEISPTLAIELLKTHGEKVMDAVKSAVEVASTSGKTKVRKAQTAEKPDVFSRAKFVKKAAPKLYEAADLVFKDPGFAGLSQDTRELLEKLLAEIQGNDEKGQTNDPDQSEGQA